jgi:hypothetical protein
MRGGSSGVVDGLNTVSFAADISQQQFAVDTAARMTAPGLFAQWRKAPPTRDLVGGEAGPRRRP